MLPHDLQAEQFNGYPTEARKLAVLYIGTLKQLPLAFLPSLLREVIDYDVKFPAERVAIEKELAKLSSLSPVEMREWFQAFSEISLSSKFEQLNWVGHPAQFTEQLSEYLWSTHQLDAFRKVATEYGERLRSAVPPEPPVTSRLGIAVIGQGLSSYDAPLFRNLREHGTYFARVKPDNGVELLLKAVAARAQAHPVPYGHWYIEGGQEFDYSALLTCVSYQALEPVRTALLRNMQAEIKRPGMGPEQLRTHLAQLSPSDIGMNKSGDAVLHHFELKLLTEASGTQIFSTTFAQWAAREALRRAQPLTLLVRFGPRQRQRPMNELLSNNAGNPDLDLIGSLIDADMGAYYNWINQQRLPGSERSSFLVWFEGHGQALAIGPTLARATTSNSIADLGELLSWAIG
ncbi:hypothetical protein H7849_07105 [Alloacidobacterium dinghuense]|uniref:Uncharacterized protein n=1 Tax=Alloacidobacterium dinghuense TaxID=2763107 RepID=A0A7G8BMB6_9BACT|nr:hypothetical protein [Alloacidobacterium dinghuense]QNI33686.1 hypothetical protein H7849_07105 [Alloacidobacterium dinghuense]